MLDRMTHIADELNRLGTTVLQSFVLSTFVLHLLNEYSFVRQLSEGQDFDRDEYLKCVKARHNSLKHRSRQNSFVSRSKQMKKYTDRIRCYSCQGFGNVNKICPSRHDESLDSKKSVSESNERVENSEHSNKLNESDQFTEDANVAAASRDDLDRQREFLFVRIQSSVAVHRRGKTGGGKANAPRGTGVLFVIEGVASSACGWCRE